MEYRAHGQGEEVAIMSRVTGGIIGFVLGGGLAVCVLTVVLAISGMGAEDVVQYLLLRAGLWGSVIGAAIGVIVCPRNNR